MAGSLRDERARVRGAQAGSASDFEALFRAHWGPAYRAAYLVVRDAAAAEDIAQEAFLAAVRALDRFDRRRPFGPWLHRIVVNRAIDWARARALRPESSGRRGAAPDRPERDDELLRELGAAVAGTPRRDRAALPARLHAGRDRRAARAAARDGELAAAPRARRAREGSWNEVRARRESGPAEDEARVGRSSARRYAGREPVRAGRGATARALVASRSWPPPSRRC